ncbi:hypothetical protein CPCC7001_2251 [Cyanobium sp. PCC 7001]|nr:hypothetical protein CPCC7001_2251 [Cyanobium sp. PCC 7001]
MQAGAPRPVPGAGRRNAQLPGAVAGPVVVAGDHRLPSSDSDLGVGRGLFRL